MTQLTNLRTSPPVRYLLGGRTVEFLNYYTASMVWSGVWSEVWAQVWAQVCERAATGEPGAKPGGIAPSP